MKYTNLLEENRKLRISIEKLSEENKKLKRLLEKYEIVYENKDEYILSEHL